MIRDKLPDISANLAVPHPLEPSLRDLAPLALDVLQLAYNHQQLATILNQSAATDLDTARVVLQPPRRRLPAGGVKGDEEPAGDMKAAATRAESEEAPALVEVAASLDLLARLGGRRGSSRPGRSASRSR